MNILDNYLYVIYKHYNKGEDGFVAGFVSRTILASVLSLYLINVYLIIQLFGWDIEVIRESSLKYLKYIVIVFFISIRIIVEFTTINNQALDSVDDRGGDYNRYEVSFIWLAAIGIFIFLLLLIL